MIYHALTFHNFSKLRNSRSFQKFSLWKLITRKQRNIYYGNLALDKWFILSWAELCPFVSGHSVLYYWKRVSSSIVKRIVYRTQNKFCLYVFSCGVNRARFPATIKETLNEFPLLMKQLIVWLFGAVIINHCFPKIILLRVRTGLHLRLTRKKL